ncbi:brassinosteroid-related acyltransferase 1 [Canna indica]|uniref:Brassinosteroid-related acyltransferase 1 n=1 Tax=Canna indica TaxID=4628 RepID=A0AAQ3L692_9LILI|nr:brassinosteroid-related acyltransferase 1 [Canna indica]
MNREKKKKKKKKKKSILRSIMAAGKREEDYPEVFTTKRLTVYPTTSPPTCSRLIHLSSLDRKCPALMYLVFFYRSPPPPSLFSCLKRGLEDTISTWYPAAGRLCVTPPGNKLNLACTNAGALFLEAATRAKISDLGDDLSQHNDFYRRLVFRPPADAALADVPLVAAQVTRFACGGYAIGVGTNHALFDGSSNYSFLSAWAAKTAAATLAVGRRGEGSRVELFEPVHERGRLLLLGSEHVVVVQNPQVIARMSKSSTCAGRRQEGEGSGGDGMRTMRRFMALDHLHQLIKQVAELGSSSTSTGENDLVLRTFGVGRGAVSRLKSKAAASDAAACCSSFEVVAAHLWKARTRALNIPNERMVCLQFAVDARTRMHPPLPKSFTGNAYVLSSVACTAAELQQHSLAAVVDKIKEAKRAVTHDYVASYVAALDAAPPPQQVALPPLPELTMVSDWTKTPYHKIDFGAGEAACVTPLATPLPQVAYFMQSPREAGRVDVRIGLPQRSLQAFSHYFLSEL